MSKTTFHYWLQIVATIQERNKADLPYSIEYWHLCGIREFSKILFQIAEPSTTQDFEAFETLEKLSKEGYLICHKNGQIPRYGLTPLATELLDELEKHASVLSLTLRAAKPTPPQRLMQLRLSQERYQTIHKRDITPYDDEIQALETELNLNQSTGPEATN